MNHKESESSKDIKKSDNVNANDINNNIHNTNDEKIISIMHRLSMMLLEIICLGDLQLYNITKIIDYPCIIFYFITDIMIDLYKSINVNNFRAIPLYYLDARLFNVLLEKYACECNTTRYTIIVCGINIPNVKNNCIFVGYDVKSEDEIKNIKKLLEIKPTILNLDIFYACSNIMTIYKMINETNMGTINIPKCCYCNKRATKACPCKCRCYCNNCIMLYSSIHAKTCKLYVSSLNK